MTFPFITSSFLNITNACNLACRYCFVKQNPDYMTYQTAKDSVDFLIRNAEAQGDIPSVNFFGGEPLIGWDRIIVPITDYIRKEYGKPFRLSMTSNCILMDRVKLDYMAENNIRLLFSIDGDKDTQDYNRPCPGGASSFDILREKIPMILEYYPNMIFRATIIPETANNLYHNIQFALSLGYRNIFFIPNTMTEWPDDAKRTVELEMRKYSDYVIGVHRSGGQPPEFSTLKKMFRNIKLNNKSVKNNLYRCAGGCTADAKCGLGTSKYAAIDCFGNIYGCQEITTNDGKDSPFYIGNIYEGIDNDKRLRLTQQYNALQVSGPSCKTCKLDRICNGGCVAHNYLYSGSIHQCSDAFCWWSQLMFDEAIYIMKTLGEERNSAFKAFCEGLR